VNISFVLSLSLPLPPPVSLSLLFSLSNESYFVLCIGKFFHSSFHTSFTLSVFFSFSLSLFLITHFSFCLIQRNLSLHHTIRLSHRTHRSNEQRLSDPLCNGRTICRSVSSLKGQVPLHLRPGSGVCTGSGSCCRHLQHTKVHFWWSSS
jgi:hypothetical protein